MHIPWESFAKTLPKYHISILSLLALEQGDDAVEEWDWQPAQLLEIPVRHIVLHADPGAQGYSGVWAMWVDL